MNFLLVTKLLRVKDYLKNFIILIPIFYAKRIFDYDLIQELFIIFITLNLSASIVYIFNDLVDLNNDIKDNYKKNRPLPSKKITKNQAYKIILSLFITLTTILLLKQNLELIFFLSLYLILNLFYSIYLKKLFLIDILCLTLFYIIRILLVIFYFNLEVSYWLITIIFFIIITVSLAKRYMDINNNIDNDTFKSLYQKKSLYIMIISSSVISQFAYIFFSVDANTINKFGEDFVFSSIIFMLGFFRFLQAVKKGKYSDTVDLFSKDWQFILILVIYIFFNFNLIYLSS
tara:strand:- start:3350 stop:4213 length:864 start_codon:yes stop_codon:yes gene_type:complete